jgi:hypothetical protein
MCEECIIGLWYDYDITELITLNELKENVKENNKLVREIKKDYPLWDMGKIMLLNDYFDKRKSVNMTRFDYCPYCGNKIDWKSFKKEGINNE